MKKLLTITSVVILVWSCTKKMTPAKSEIPASNTGAVVTANTPATTPSGTENTKSTNTETPATPVVGAVAAANSPVAGAKVVERAGSGNDPAAIEGQAIFNAKCQRCHGLKVVSNYTVERWISVMQVMAMKAGLTDTEKENVLAYVKANAKH